MTEKEKYEQERRDWYEARSKAINPLNPIDAEEWRTQNLLNILITNHRMSQANLNGDTFPIVQQVRHELNHKAYLLTGVTGSGKTRAGYGLLRYFSVYGPKDALKTREIHCVEALELEEAIHRNEYGYLDGLKKVDVLMVDDLGTEANRYKSQDFKAVLNAIFNYRYNDTDKITIITTNLGIDELKKDYERMISRIKEIGNAFSAGETDLRKPEERVNG